MYKYSHQKLSTQLNTESSSNPSLTCELLVEQRQRQMPLKVLTTSFHENLHL